MADFSKLSAAVTQLQTDQAKLAADVTAFIASHPPADATEQAQIDAITTSLAAVDTAVQGMDAALNPPAATPPASTAPAVP